MLADLWAVAHVVAVLACLAMSVRWVDERPTHAIIVTLWALGLGLWRLIAKVDRLQRTIDQA